MTKPYGHRTYSEPGDGMKHVLALFIGAAILGGLWLMRWLGPTYGGAILALGLACMLGRGVLLMRDNY
jgi:hypothetical protein